MVKFNDVEHTFPVYKSVRELTQIIKKYSLSIFATPCQKNTTVTNIKLTLPGLKTHRTRKEQCKQCSRD